MTGSQLPEAHAITSWSIALYFVSQSHLIILWGPIAVQEETIGEYINVCCYSVSNN